MSFPKLPTKAEYEEQERLWVAGESRHIGTKTEGSCTPDFSCCQPSLLQPLEVRQAFAAADEKGRNKFLGAFLGAMIAAATTKKVHIAGRGEGDT